jgi:hypothetical protein
MCAFVPFKAALLIKFFSAQFTGIRMFARCLEHKGKHLQIEMFKLHWFLSFIFNKNKLVYS